MPVHKKDITLAAFTAGLIASQYLRNFVSVIAPQLTTDFKLTPTSFSWFTASFFIAFALAQIPLGMAFDRIGVRRPTVIAMLLGVVSLIAFASAPNAWFALVTMAGIGVACAPIFTGLMIFVGELADESRGLRTLTIVSAIGVAGSLLAGTPLGLATEVFGWRASIAWSSLLLAVPAVVIWFGMADKLQPRPSDEPPTIVAPLAVGRMLLPILPACLAMAAGSALRSSWAGPYLGVAFGATSRGIGDAMTVVSIVAIAFGFAVPALLVRISPHALSKMTWVIGTVAAILLALLPSVALTVSVGGLAVLVALGGAYPVVIDQARRLFPSDKSGLALSAASMCAFLSVSLLSLLFGAVGGIAKAAEWGDTTSFAIMFGLTAVVCFGALWNELRARC